MGSLRLEHVTKRYSDVVAVDDMDIELEDGEFVSLVGPSGCGKSTTLEIIGGLTKPSDGTVYIDDRDVTDLPPKDRDLAMVFQNIALFPHMDVYDNISYGLRIRKVDENEIEQRVDSAIEILQLEGMLDRMPSELSGGQRQRVAIGRAIVRDPDVFLMDEPLANLDAKLRVHMRTEIQRLQQQLDVTTVYVTHDQEEAMTMSDRIAIINGGKLQQFAPPLTCYNEPANRFVAGFIGSPSMNFFDGTIDGDTLTLAELELTIDGVDVSPAREDVILGIRPEDVYPAADAPELPGATSPVSVSVDVIEPVGEKQFIYLLAGESPDGTAGVGADANEATVERADAFLMSADPDYDTSPGETIEVVFDRSAIHVFDAATGDAIAHSVHRDATTVPE